MPHFDLDPLASDLVTARMETDNRLRLELEKFDRFAARKRERFARERANNQARLSATLARVIGEPVPKGAQIGLRADGQGVVEWPDAPAPAKVPSAAPEGATITPIPTNGELAASHS